jgi:hypothetical protein
LDAGDQPAEDRSSDEQKEGVPDEFSLDPDGYTEKEPDLITFIQREDYDLPQIRCVITGPGGLH